MPNGERPEQAYVIGDGKRYGSLETEASILKTTTGQTREKFQTAQNNFKLPFNVIGDRLDAVFDGQNALQSRTDLLDDSNGYATAFMSKNWNIPHNRWVVLPFDSVLGPVRNAQVVRPESNSGWLALKAGGLWRVDAHVTVSGYTTNVTWMPLFPSGGYLHTTYDPIRPQFMLEVMNSAGELLTARQFDKLPNVSTYTADSFNMLNHPSTISFNHTFVLDNMRSGGFDASEWVYARLSMKFAAVGSWLTLAGTVCTAQGGTARSALTASRWSRDAVNNVVAPEVPDGGDLT
ncbi:hypothetical protein CH253_08075 [Rhodococcus sp. 06-156-3C]|nr:hypothetical protein CH253_08075 [Rhodococcus sp. 06-156-3C]